MKKIIKKILTFINIVLYLGKAKISLSSFVYGNIIFEGKNKVNSYTVFTNSVIGYASYIGQNCVMSHVVIGRFCSIGDNVKVVIGKHPTSIFVSTHPCFYSKSKQSGFTFINESKFDEYNFRDDLNNISVNIENDVWIGSNVLILNGIKIGNGAIIAAGSVVVKDVEPYAIYGGNPAKLIKKRFTDKEIDFLEQFHWYSKDISWIKENANLFENIELFYSTFKDTIGDKNE